MAASHTATKTTITAVRITLPHMCPASAGRLSVEAVASLWEEHKPRGLRGPPDDRPQLDNYSNGER
jgi:hypothetical protein